MTGDDNKKSPGGEMAKQRDPDWASGLKQLYDSVVEETLPDSIRELLLKLDDDKSDVEKPQVGKQ